MPIDKEKRQVSGMIHEGEEGVALLTTLLIMLIMTVLGMGAVVVTALENRIAGFQRTGESATSAAESCVGTSVNIIQQTLLQGEVPTAYYATAADPVPNASATAASPNSLFDEIMGRSDNNVDSPVVVGATSAAPDYSQTVGGFAVTGDIDRMYAVLKSGTGIQFAGGYEGIGGGAGGGGVDILYRIDCRANLAATATESRILAVYACTMTGETCQKKL
ncbi:MAG: PilX N-terminal domain-containing pilus assembly protein [Nitrospiraceae bacterium]